MTPGYQAKISYMFPKAIGNDILKCTSLSNTTRNHKTSFLNTHLAKTVIIVQITVALQTVSNYK